MRARTSALVVSVVLILAALALSGCQTKVVTSEAGTLNTVTASGEGKQVAAPDEAEMSFGVTAQGTNAEETLAEASKKSDAIVEAVKEAGIPEDDIQTAGVNLSPEYDYKSSEVPRIVGYQASVQVRVTVRDITKVGDVINAASAAGATDMSGPSFMLSEDSEARSAAIEDAVADAKARAETMAAAAGKSVGEVISLAESGINVPVLYGTQRALGDSVAAAEAAPEIQTGTLDVTANVTVVFELK